MANQPPYGPPQYHGYPPPPNSNIAFVPAPVMMPIYPPAPPPPMPENNPTYVTNYYYPPSYQQPEQPPIVQPVEEPIDWVSATTSSAVNYSHRAFVGGREGWDGSPLWIIRAHHSGEFIPGKLAIKHRAAYVPYCGKEVPVHNFEILLAQPSAVRWLPGSYGQVPIGAIPAGNTHAGEPLYIARVSHQGSFTPGKVHPSHQCSYISFGGREMSFREYEVLCKVVG
ncbi:unnamed protein product [Chilo suppressalis]|uniref:Farnesoic acid O-methyl transferase domain-containing protein n=1 Tax=Chilo suppressalis TaxID=168631 RepID=A0ABN8AVD1_CHISP|nr:hypothetical protein evm_011400 [Chilo suppressalis]CAH0399177.1 unnamed protein product [Chilo suppressalis]